MEEIIMQLTWLGLIGLLLLRPALRLTLTAQCQLCGERFSSAHLLLGHLTREHEQELQDSRAWYKLLHWQLFETYGCVCNPSVHHGTPGHQCPLILQVAALVHRSDEAIIIPWSYRATDLVDVFEPHFITGQTLTKVTTLMMARNFPAILHSPEVYRLVTFAMNVSH